jgi:hypothetical protein
MRKCQKPWGNGRRSHEQTIALFNVAHKLKLFGPVTHPSKPFQEAVRLHVAFLEKMGGLFLYRTRGLHGGAVIVINGGVQFTLMGRRDTAALALRSKTNKYKVRAFDGSNKQYDTLYHYDILYKQGGHLFWKAVSLGN